MTEHEYWDELAAGFALHALSADEEVAFIDHLAACDECAANMKDHDLVAAQLGTIAHYREPEDEVPSWESMRGAIVGSRADRAEVVDLASKRRRYELSRRSLAVAAAAVVVAGGGIVTWQVAGGGSRCSASAGCHVVRLEAASAGGKTAALLTVRNLSVTIDASKMSAPPAGKEYVLWQQPRDGRATPIKEFTATTGTTISASLAAPYSDTQQFAVSLESVGPPPATPSGLLASGLAT